MSSQSILVRTVNEIQEKSEKTVLKGARYHILEKRFALIKKINKDKVRHAKKLLSFICTENCELIGFINKTLIKGEGLDTTCIFSEVAESPTELSDYTQIFENNLE